MNPLPTLDPGDFDAFLDEVFGYAPYPYQRELCRRLCAGEEVAGVVAPTGLGKTALVPAWAFALAYQAERGAHRRVPLRLVWVVSRRLIVDAVHDSTRYLAEALTSAVPGTVTDAVATRLRALHGNAHGVAPLGLTRMRANVDWPRVWQVRPDAAHVVSATVDQVGSRMLFRGYGVSAGMRPVDAALLGCDSLVALDEAHLSQAFRATLQSMARMQAAATGLGPANRPSVVVTVTATPPEGTAGHLVTLGAEDWCDHRVQMRLAAARPVRFGPGKAGRGEPAQVAERLAGEAQLLRRDNPELRTLIVFANTVEAARGAYEQLVAAEPDARIELLTGRARPADAERLRREVLPLIDAGRSRSECNGVTVVSTQTLEVGADVDCDAMVTELADSAAIIQRCGRVNRAGGPFQSPVVVVDARSDDPVYGRATTGPCREWIEALAATLEGLSARRLAGLAAGVPLPPSTLAAPPPPVLTPERAHDLARTNPPPRPDPPVDLFLHGQAGSATVSLVWRCDARRAARALGAPRSSGPVARWLGPISVDEMLELPMPTAKAWLRRIFGGGPAVGLQTSDLEGTGLPVGEAEIDATGAVVLREGGAHLLRELRPGDVVIVPSDVGGCDRHGWAPASAAHVTDLSLGGATLRLSRDTISALYGPEGVVAAEDFLRLIDGPEQELGEADVAEVLGALALIATGEGPNPATRVGRRPAWEHVRGLGVVVRPRNSRFGLPDGADRHSARSRQAVGLAQHLEDTAERAAEIAANLGLPPVLARPVELAAGLHDLGKADPRQQQILRGGDAPEAATEPLAKSATVATSAAAYLAVAERAGWPRRARHEHLSVLMLDGHPILGDHVGQAELVLHLVGSHHGHGRPFYPSARDPSPPGAKCELAGEVFSTAEGHEHTDWDAPERFHRLVDRYGPWGLAWLETLVRSADMSVSAEYDQGARHG